MSPTHHKNHNSPRRQKYNSPEEASHIYLFPNLFTAGNMLCGFLSVTCCIKAKYQVLDVAITNNYYKYAVYCILGACIFDLFDGRIARAFKRESLFGAEFDSIADIVSFGMAPALMVYFLILDPADGANANLGIIGNIGHNFGWLFAFLYLLCVGIRLARFNVLTNPLVPGNDKKKTTDEFVGLPSPWAAGMIASLVLLLTHINIDEPNIVFLRRLMILLLPIVLGVSYLMISNIRYPSFKHINWNTRLKIPAFLGMSLVLLLTILWSNYLIPCIFLVFILTGIIYTTRKKILIKKSSPKPPPSVNNPANNP